MTDEADHGANHKDEIEVARKQIEVQVTRQRVRSGVTASMAGWWREQRDQNNFRVLLEDLLIHKRG